MKKNALINAANIHSGGAIQVATSFIEELVGLNELNFNIIVSSEINNELIQLNLDTNLFDSYEIYDVYGLNALFDFKFIKILKSYEKIFTVFGPLYSFKKPKKSIVGFAQPWIIYPNNEIYNSYNLVNKIKSKLKYSLQGYFFLREDEIIVEQEHVKSKLSRYKSTKNIHIVYNCVSSIFNNRDKWSKLSCPKKNNEIRLGILSRDYPHKNLKILPMIGKILNKKYDFQIRFLVTLTSEEWRKKDSSFYEYVDNVGKLDMTECPSFYDLIDGVIFPSLLECFSATPIEAMMMKKPIFASDRLFVQQVCGENAFYFDPNDANDVASKIYEYFSKKGLSHNKHLYRAYNRALKYNNPNLRDKKYIEILNNN